jgi:phospho-N-acetylmuramoyl-pentapeptide-transferase
MGDTGSLALGGLLAGGRDRDQHPVPAGAARRAVRRRDAVGDRQVAVFRTTGRTGAAHAPPCTTTSSCSGGQETTIIVRFWIIAGMGVALGLGVFYAEYLSRFGPLG